MRPILVVLPLLLSLAAHAQVATDDTSLNALRPPAPAATPKHAPTPKSTHPPARLHRPAGTAPRLPATPIPAAPPANPVLAPPPFVMPAHAKDPPPPVPVRTDAPGVVSPLQGGIRITFGTGTGDLNPSTLTAIRTVAARMLTTPALIVGVTAWAAGTADDPSTSRRLSLDRALAVRAVLINAGIASDRIRAVAKGDAEIGTGPADRADVLDMLAPH